MQAAGGAEGLAGDEDYEEDDGEGEDSEGQDGDIDENDDEEDDEAVEKRGEAGEEVGGVENGFDAEDGIGEEAVDPGSSEV